jgi:hypothetical protein
MPSSSWLWILLALAGVFCLWSILLVLRKAMFTTAVLTRYPGGIELGGSSCGGQITYRIVQWLDDPAHPQPCPLAVHLPGGDLVGNALCDLNATVRARELGAPSEFEIFPYHQADGKIIGVSLRLIPEGLPGVRPVMMSIGGKKFSLPLTGEEAVRLLGAPLSQSPRSQ